MKPELWDKMNDLEQKIMRQTLVTEEFCDSVLEVLEKADIPAKDFDTISNLLIGLKTQVDVGTTSLSDMVQAVFKDHIGPQIPSFSGILSIEEDGTIMFPPSVFDVLGWKPGDTLKYTLMPENGIMIRKNERVVL